MHIRILPNNIVNRIAAGEVVERPASVVKELIENSIDAGASRISTVIEQGGRNLISITDNGSGMSKDDLVIAVDRHATSKLDTENLANICFFGFRGEALPSIASVSRMHITSKNSAAGDAWSLKIDGGNKSEPTPSSCNQGTKIEIRDLFFATPARLKFLKTEKTEQQHIIGTINQFAMAYPEIEFSLIADGKRLISLENPSGNTKSDKLLNRLQSIIGKDFTDNALPIDANREGATLSGFVGLPTFSKGSSVAQYFFVNNRPVKDKLFYGALRGAYQDFLARDRHPVVVLFLTIPNEEVDVNVHPAKSEVRFRDSASVRGLIVGAVKNALTSAGHRASTTVSQAALSSFTPGNNFPTERYANSQSSPLPASGSYLSEKGAGSNYMHAPQQNLARQIPLEVNDLPSARSGMPLEEQQVDFSQHPLGAARCQLHETYIVSQTTDGLVITDQHAAHERLVYEKMKTSMAENGIKTQNLLIPEIVELSADVVEQLIEKREEFLNLGLAINKFSDTAISVTETPAILGGIDVPGLIKTLADELSDLGEGLFLKEKLEHVCGTIACHGSVRSGRVLNTSEMNALLREMEATPHSGQCNHGRPTYVELKLTEIEKLFGRT